MLVSNLEQIVKQYSKCTVSFKKRKAVVCMFDLTNSTKMKFDDAKYGIGAAIAHNNICKAISKKFDGILIKEIGDEVLIVFSNPLNALWATLNIKKALEMTDLLNKGALTWGEVNMIIISDRMDVMSTSVDLCARIIDCALPNQFLIDSNLYNQISNVKKINIEMKAHSFLVKNFNNIKCYEIS